MAVDVNGYLAGFGKITTSPSTRTLTFSDTSNMTQVKSLVWREGRFLMIESLCTWSGAGVGAGAWTMTLPDSLVIDTDMSPGGTTTSNAGRSRYGTCLWFDSGVGWTTLHGEYASTTTIVFAYAAQTLAANQLATGDGVKISLRIPINGWF